MKEQLLYALIGLVWGVFGYQLHKMIDRIRFNRKLKKMVSEAWEVYIKSKREEKECIAKKDIKKYEPVKTSNKRGRPRKNKEV